MTQTCPVSVSVIIPCHNSARTIAATLASLRTLQPAPDEIICVDDGSVDETRALLQRWREANEVPIVVLTADSPRRGAASARNRGAAVARGEYLWFLDSDVVAAADDLLGLLFARLHLPDCVACVGLYRETSLLDGALAHFQAHFVRRAFEQIDQRDSPYFGTQCVLLRAADFRQAGGFDERYGGATVEDFAFGCRLRARGACIHVEPRAEIIHNHAYRWSSFTKNYYTKARDLTALLLEQRVLARTGGYMERANQLALTLLCLEGLVLVAFSQGAFSSPWPLLAAPLAIALLWGAHLLALTHVHGALRALQFFFLRSYVVMVAGVGGCVAATQHLCKRARRLFAALPTSDVSDEH